MRPPWSGAACPATRPLRRARLADVPAIERVYVNDRARAELGWTPRYDFAHALDLLAAGEDFRSPLARAVGAKGYHAETTGVYTTRA